MASLSKHATHLRQTSFNQIKSHISRTTNWKSSQIYRP